MFLQGFFICKKYFQKYLVIRLYGYIFAYMKSEKRKQRAYKAKDNSYNKARKRAIKEGGSLAKLIECVVIVYGAGFYINAEWNKNGGSKTLSLDEVLSAAQLDQFKKVNQ